MNTIIRYSKRLLGEPQKLLVISLMLYFIMGSKLYASQKINAVTEIFPPLQMFHERTLTGLGVEVVDELVQITGFETEMSVLPWARAYKYALQNKNTLIFTIARTKHREQLFKWVGSFDFKDKLYIWTLKSKNIQKNISWDDLILLNTAAPRSGSQLDNLLNNGFSETKNLFITNNDRSAIEMLYRERIDFIIAGEHTLNYQLSLLNLNTNNLKKHEITKMENENSSELSIAFNIHTSDKIVNSFKSALNEIKKNGRLKELIIKWK